jgi:hypothetical protein
LHESFAVAAPVLSPEFVASPLFPFQQGVECYPSSLLACVETFPQGSRDLARADLLLLGVPPSLLPLGDPLQMSIPHVSTVPDGALTFGS